MPKLIKGQVVFRETRDKAPGDRRRLFMVVGIIAVPENVEIRGEHQYTIFGTTNDILHFPTLPLTIDISSAKDVRSISEGLAMGQLLTEAMWRV